MIGRRISLARARGVLLALACTATMGTASAQGYPDRQVKVIVPFPPGATMDSVVRLVAQKLTDDWGKPVVVENKTGAAGVIGTQAGAKAPPDGYTMLAVANSFAANPSLRTDLPYDTEKDFVPVSFIGSTPLVLVAHKSVPASSTAELVALARQQPGQISYGAAPGASPHMAMAWLESAAKMKLLFVPYRGQSQAQTDLLAGQVKLAFGNLPDVMPYVQSGDLKALGIATHERSPLAPAIPTLAEAGYRGPEWDSWYGFLAPVGTPDEIVKKFAAGVASVLSQRDVKSQLNKVGMVPVGSTPEEFAAFLRRTAQSYAQIIKEAGIRVQ